MTEYIINLDGMFTIIPDELEEIVRCCDCKHYMAVDEIFSDEDDITIYGCELLKWKGASFGFEEPTDPDGFCAWGERKMTETTKTPLGICHTVEDSGVLHCSEITERRCSNERPYSGC